MLAHHQYISNGSHGNAECDLLCLLFLEGKGVKRFVEDTVCGKADYYFSGHDHNQQWLQPECGTEFIVTGAGSRASPFVPRPDNNPVYWADDTLVGFMWVEIRDNTFTGEFYDLYGNLFKSGVVSGIGGNSATGGLAPGANGQIDVRKLSPTQYREIREKNPELLGLKPKRGR